MARMSTERLAIGDIVAVAASETDRWRPIQCFKVCGLTLVTEAPRTFRINLVAPHVQTVPEGGLPLYTTESELSQGIMVCDMLDDNRVILVRQ